MLPATYMTYHIIRKSVQDNNAAKFVKNEMDFKGTQIISQDIDIKNKTLNVVAVGKLIGKRDIAEAEKRLSSYKLKDYALNVIQGAQSDSLLNSSENARLVTKDNSRKLIEQSEQINNLETKLAQYTRYGNMSKEISREIHAIYPEITKISLSDVTECRTDTTASRRYVLAVIGSKKEPEAEKKAQLQRWLKVKTQADSLRIIITK